MPEEADPNAPDTPEVDDAEEFDADRAKAKIAKANNEASNLRKRLKELEAKAAQLDELEDAKKTEVERLAEQQKTLEARAAQAEQDSARLRVAMNRGLTEAQAKRLVGSTVEELEADAEELLATFKPEEPAPEPPGRPKERLQPGALPDAAPEADIRSIVDSIPRGL